VSGESVVEYGELERRATRLARKLRRSGVGSGSRVGVHLKRSIDLVTALIAVMKIGATWVPLDPEHPESRLAAILEDSAAAFVLTNEASCHDLRSSGRIVVVDEAGPIDDSSFEVFDTVSPDATACLLYASNANGQLRGAPLSYRALASVTSAFADEV